MSFFFSKQKAKPVKRGSVPAKPTQAGKTSKETLNRLGCRVCPLDKANNCTPKMPPDLGELPTDVYFLGEGPNEVDDDLGVPFSSEAGKLLKSILGNVDDYSFDNAVRDYDHYKDQPSWVAMECCRSLIVKSIEKAKPKMVVGLGIAPLQWMLNSADMVGLRGRVFAVKIGNHACWFMPTYSPQFIIDNAYEGSEPLRSKLGHCLKFDLKRATTLCNELGPPTIDTPQQARAGIQAFNGQSRNQLAPLLKLISEARKAPEKAIDLETSCLRPYKAGALLLTAAVSFGNVNFAFAVDHPKSGFKPDEKKAIKSALKELLSDETTIIAHNAPFEIEWLIFWLGRDAIFHDVWECTMMQAHFLDERRGKRGGNDDQFQPNPYQALDFLVKQHFGLAYKALFKLDRKNMAKADLDETLLYNGADTKYTLRLYKDQKARLRQDNLLEAYREAQPRQPAVALMQSIGIATDHDQTMAMQAKLGREIEFARKKIFEVDEVKQFVKDRREFNPASNPDLIRLFDTYFNMGNLLINAEGKKSVDKIALAKIKHPISMHIEEFKNRSHLKSTYVDPFELGKGAFIWPDKFIHPSFNTTFAETGRTSCTAHWTPVLTARGEIPIRDVCVGDLVWTHKDRWKPVTALWRKGWEVMLRLKLSNGSILTCTKNHLLLSASGKWITAGEIYGLFQKMDKCLSECSGSFNPLPLKENVFDKTNCGRIKNYRIKCLVGNQKSFAQGRVQNTQELALLNVQIGRQKPNERLDGREGSPVERRYRRWSRIQNYPAQRETYILPPLCLLSGVGASDETSSGVGNSSHRREPTQQRAGQLSPCNWQRAQGYPLTSKAGFEVTYIEEIEIGGSCEVFDITVADDASYLTCGVVSHNSDEPNQQNWPSRNDKWVRKQIKARKGHVLLAFDYGQLEACTGAMCSKDKVFVKALWEDYDIHMEWAQRSANLYPALIGGKHMLTDKDVMKKWRSLVKNKLVFPAFFGAAEKSVQGYLEAATGVAIPDYVTKKLFSDFWRDFSGFGAWQKRLVNKYYDVGFVESLTGRRRHYPLSRPQAINYPIQSLGCDIVCRAMVTLSELAASTGKWYLHPIMNIHDDLTFDVPDDPKILDDAINIIYRVMLDNVYPFINVPLSVSCSIGDNWLEMDEIQKFWSNKDL